MAAYYALLRSGNDLCERRPEMTPKLIQQVTDIYQKCRRINPDDIPLIDAANFGYDHMVWGFIECAKQTHKDLHTGKTLDLQKFLGYRDYSGKTALHTAARYDNVEVVRVLLEHVSVQMLISDRDEWGRTSLTLLRDPKYDEFILKTMKAATNEKGDQLVLDLIDIKHQEPTVYKECVMDVNSYPKSHTNENRSSLQKLNQGVCELAHPNKNTILHLVCKFGDVNYTKLILEKHSSLIYHRNSDGETPLYVAAREGQTEIVQLLISYNLTNDELVQLATRNMDKQTALHIAIQNHHVGVVFLLVKEIPQLANHINEYNASPLYLAVERNYYYIFRLILDECKEITFDGPDGKTALHASVVIDKEHYTQDLLGENKDLLYIHDKHGWTPLHYAAHYDKTNTIKALLDKDPNIGFQMTTGNDINTSALHIAVSRGHRESVKVIMSKCPQCSEIVDTKGRNILHVAVESKKRDMIELIFEDTTLTNLINQRDGNGDTPIHLYVACDVELEKMVIDYKVNIHVRNNENLTPLDMTSSDEKRYKLIKAIQAGVTSNLKQREIELKQRESDLKQRESAKQSIMRQGNNVYFF